MVFAVLAGSTSMTNIGTVTTLAILAPTFQLVKLMGCVLKTVLGRVLLPIAFPLVFFE
jgi:hypothetical protein